MSNDEYIVNWKQGEISNDKLIGMHRKSNKQPECQLDKMVQYSEFNSEESAQKEMRSRNHSSYKHCKIRTIPIVSISTLMCTT